MRWNRARRSSNVEDRRGMRVGAGVAGGGGLIALVIVLVSLFTGQDPGQLVGQLEQGGEPSRSTVPGGEVPGAPSNDPQIEFVERVLGSTEDAWTEVFARGGSTYQPARLVVFEEAVRSACGTASSAVGPFYCPADAQVYVDLGFFRELSQRFGAPGDFARAYVIAHEVGHHVQNLSGIAEQVARARSRASEAEGNLLSVRQELQADCLAGVWGHHAGVRQGLLEEGDIEEGLRAAEAIGDDTLQRQAGGAVVPESWTHGSSEQRARWLRRGLTAGTIDACDTFGPDADIR